MSVTSLKTSTSSRKESATSHDSSEVPLIDLGLASGTSTEQHRLVDEINRVCHHVGFFIIVNHGIESQFVDSVFDMSRKLFALPLEQKTLIDKRQSRHFRGWESEGTEYTNNRPDIREQVDLWSEHPALDPQITPDYLRMLGPNQWFPEDVLPGYRQTMNLWFKNMQSLGNRLMELLARGLDLPPDYFENLFGDQPMCLTKIIHYPATPKDQFGVNAHHDTGFVTALATGGTPGLEIENSIGDWVPVPIVDNSFVINLGEMLQAISGNYFVATPHRVFANSERYSLGYFHGPSLDTQLRALPLNDKFKHAVATSPRHANAGYMAGIAETVAGVGDMQSQYHPSTFGEQIWNYLGRSYPDLMRQHYK